MDLPRGIFTRSPRAIAQGLKRAVMRSRRTKARTKLQSAMSMLNYHINRGGRALSTADRARLQAAKRELRKAFERPPSGGRRAA
jgi:Tfp pilus assembly protein PilE